MKKVILIFLVFIQICLFSFGDIKLDGYYKSFFTVMFPSDYESMGTLMSEEAQGLLNSRIRLNLSTNLAKNLNFKVSYDFSPGITTENPLGEMFGSLQVAQYRIIDFDSRIYPGEGKESGSFELHNNLDRLY